jgi:2-C-methyl-D-erythritol 4-phosphate cytidylyltransferase
LAVVACGEFTAQPRSGYHAPVPAENQPTQGQPTESQPTESQPTESQHRAAAVILASGAGVRVGGALNKVYMPLGGRSVVAWSLRTFAVAEGVGALLLVVRPQDQGLAEQVLTAETSAEATGWPTVEIIHGGVQRQDSELMALRQLAPRIGSGEIDVVLMHDAARPLVSGDLVSAVLAAASEPGGAVPGVPTPGLVMASEDGGVAAADLGTMMAMQTPQGFLAAPLLAAYEQAAADGFYGTDTAACMTRYCGLPARCVPGEDRNIKITYPHDLVIAEKFLAFAGRLPCTR